MAYNYRLEPTNRIAQRRFPRDREGRLILPRVVERNPAPGDVHPLSRAHLIPLLRHQPADYVYGLTRVELRPRVGAVADPFGYYLPKARIVVLYSVPATEWRLRGSSNYWCSLYRHHGAAVEVQDAETVIQWRGRLDLAYFMYREVFLHELGHHHDEQFRHKRRYPRGLRYEERSADLHAFRLAKRQVFAYWHEVEERGQHLELAGHDAPDVSEE
jgi:hypothetical protein